MTFAADDSLGPFRIRSLLGKGGMGEVYLAHDPKLDRIVALKVLPEALSSDPERVARFEREARLLAALSHQHIAAIHGFDEADGTRYLVMEYVEGESLSARLRRGRLPVDEVLTIGRQMAEALEAAHAKGIVHRDLKPANVMIDDEGHIKVLDFGLARAMSDDPGASGLSTAADSPTITAEFTRPGVVLGTAAYMSPEQARGRPLDKRTDIWSFGLILFECLTGQALFGGETATDSLGAILHKEPDWDLLPPATPPGLQVLLRRCIAKERKSRMQDIGDARLELEETIRDPQSSLLRAPVIDEPRGAGTGLAWFITVAALIAATALGVAYLRRPAPLPPERWVTDLVPPDGYGLARHNGPMVLSPDGRRIAFVASDEPGQVALFVRDLGTGETVMLDDDESPATPFWSPDGRWLAYLSETALKRIDTRGGQPEVLAEFGGQPTAGAWSRDDQIYFSSMRSGLTRLDLRTGVTELAVDLFPERSGDWLAFPSVLPDGQHLLVLNQDDVTSAAGVYVVSIDGSLTKRLLPHETFARYVAPGWLVYWRGGDLHRQPFDVATLDFTGPSERIAADVWRKGWPGAPSFSVDQRGTLVYLPGPATAASEFMWFDRTSGELSSLGLTGSLWSPRISPDSTRLAFDRTVDATAGDIAVFDLERRTETRLTRAQANESLPVWSPDGDTLYYFRGVDLYKTKANGMGSPEHVLTGAGFIVPNSISPDGRQLLYEAVIDDNSDLRLLDLESGTTSDWLCTPFMEDWGIFHSSGRWVVYETDAPGELRVMMRSFPDGEVMVPVSDGFGSEALWAGDELIYRTRTHYVSRTIDFTTPNRPIVGPAETLVPAEDITHMAPAPDGSGLVLNRLLIPRRGGTLRVVRNLDWRLPEE